MFATFAALGLAAVSLAASADGDKAGWSWDFRKIEPTGQYYIAVSYPATRYSVNDPRRAVTLAQRRPGSPPVSSMEDFVGCKSVSHAGEFFGVRAGDLTLARVEFPRRPDGVMVSSTGAGFVAVNLPRETPGRRGQASLEGDALLVVSAGGEVRHRKRLAELFTADEIAAFPRHDGAVEWLDCGWIDDARGQAIVVARPPLAASGDLRLRMIDLDDGKVATGSAEQVLAAIDEMNLQALPGALKLAAELKLGAARQGALQVLGHEELPTRTRLYAAVALAAFGDRRGADLVSDTIRSFKSHNLREPWIAMIHAPQVLGPAAVPVLRQAALDGWYFPEMVSKALAEVGPEAVAPLIEMLGDAKHPGLQSVALDALSMLGPTAKQAVPALMVMLQDADRTKQWGVASAAAGALGSIGPEAKAAIPALERLACRTAANLREARCRCRTRSYEQDLATAKAHHDAVVGALSKIRRR